MTTATTTNGHRMAKPDYKDYVNFLGNYKGSRKDDEISNQHAEAPVRNFPLSNSSNTSSSSLNSDVTDFAKTSCLSYSSYLENSKNKKFSTVRPILDESMPPTKSEDNSKSKGTMRSEIFIEIQNANPPRTTSPITKVVKIFEQNNLAEQNDNLEQQPRHAGIGNMINIFEQQQPKKDPASKTKRIVQKLERTQSWANNDGNYQKLPETSSPGAAEIQPPPPPPPSVAQLVKATEHISIKKSNGLPSPPPPSVAPLSKTTYATVTNAPPAPPPLMPNGFQPPKKVQISNRNTINNKANQIDRNAKNSNGVPSPPPPPVAPLPKTTYATVKNGPPAPPPLMPNSFQPVKSAQTLSNKNTVNNNANQIDKNDPLVRKLVYGTLRGMYGAYHEKANDFMATLPKNMVKKDNGVQKIIEHMAANGNLEKLNGRVNPNSEQE